MPDTLVAKESIQSVQLMKLVMSMEKLRQQQIDTDVQLQCKTGVVYAHKFVLRNSCAYFESMFCADMAEKESGIIDFKWCTQDAIEIVVQYLYTGQNPKTNNYTLLINVVEVSHLMQLTDLLIFCWDALISYLQVETFAELWLLGHKFDLITEDAIIVKFAQDNIAEISKNGNIENFDPEQMKKLINFVKCKELSDSLVDLILKWNIDGSNDDAAIQIIKIIDFQGLTNPFLKKLLHAYQQKQDDNPACMLMEEVLNRLTLAYKLAKDISESPRFNTPCSYHGASSACGSYGSLKHIQDLCKNFMKALE